MCQNFSVFIFCIFPHFCASFLRMPSLCQVRADTNLAIEKFYFSIFHPHFPNIPFYHITKTPVSKAYRCAAYHVLIIFGFLIIQDHFCKSICIELPSGV